MLDKRSARLLEGILRLCGEGSYKIVEIGELIKVMAPRYKVDAEAISQIAKYLVDSEYINVKYSDDKVYCMTVLPKGRIHGETNIHKKQDYAFSKRLIWAIAIGSFVAAFAGAALAIIIFRTFGG